MGDGVHYSHYISGCNTETYQVLNGWEVVVVTRMETTGWEMAYKSWRLARDGVGLRQLGMTLDAEADEASVDVEMVGAAMLMAAIHAGGDDGTTLASPAH